MKNNVIDEKGYVPKEIVTKMKKRKEEKQKKVGKVVKAR